MTRKNCPHCGTPSHADARFCRLCGASLGEVVVGEPVSSPMDVTMPHPRDLYAARDFKRNEADATSSSFSTASLVSGMIPFELREETNDLPAPPLQKDADAVNGATTIVKLADTHLALQPRTLTPLRVTVPVSRDGLPPSASAAREDMNPGEEKNFPVRPASIGENFHQAIAAEQGETKDWRWWLVASACVAITAAGLTLTALTHISSRRTTARVGDAAESVIADVPDARSESLWLMAEAERLLAAGAMEAAITRLREAVRLNNHNTRAQMQLAAALERTGRLSEAIVFYQAAAALDPYDARAWRLLGEAQFSENRFAEAAQSYRRFFELTENPTPGGASGVNDAIRSRYAEALRLASDAEQAQLLSAQTAASSISERPADEANRAGTGAELPIASASNLMMTTAKEQVRGLTAARLATPASLPGSMRSNVRNPSVKDSAEARLSPQERFERAIRLYAADRRSAMIEFEAVADSIPDAHYYLGLARIEGRPLQSVNRAELLAALKHFQIAQQKIGGRYASQAGHLAGQLGREYDRRRKNDER